MQKAPSVRVQSSDLTPIGNHDVGAELLRLGEGTARQRLPRDSRGEAEDNFSMRAAGAGLSTEGGARP